MLMSTSNPGEGRVNNFDLSLANVREYFNDENVSQSLKRFLEKLDSVDHWTFDFSDDSEAIKSAIADIEDVFNRYCNVFHLFPEKVIFILANITSSRSFYLIEHLCSLNPSFASELEKILSLSQRTQESDGDVSGRDIVLQRLQVIERTKLLEKVYSKKRYESIIRIMKSGL